MDSSVATREVRTSLHPCEESHLKKVCLTLMLIPRCNDEKYYPESILEMVRSRFYVYHRVIHLSRRQGEKMQRMKHLFVEEMPHEHCEETQSDGEEHRKTMRTKGRESHEA